METTTIQKERTDLYKISGLLDFNTVITLQRQAQALIKNAEKSLQFDFSAVTFSNSAGLALLTTLLRYAKHQNKSLQYLNLPQKLLETAKVSDLDKLLTN